MGAVNASEILRRIRAMSAEEHRAFVLDLETKRVKKNNDERPNLNQDHYVDGQLIKADGVECEVCNNRGVYDKIVDNGGTDITYETITCSCMKERARVIRFRKSGLDKYAKRYSFDNFKADEPWQKIMLDIAKEYAVSGAKDGKWLFMGGQSGSGKTHVCMAAAISLFKDYEVRYIVWPYASRKIKAVAMDLDEYEHQVDLLRDAELLYIDDFQKPVFNSNGTEALATAADVRLAYDIINYRYVNELPTIITSEWFNYELAMIDEATAGRIAESCGKYKLDIGRDTKRNYRLSCETI